MFDYGASLDGSRDKGPTVYRDGIVNEKLDPNGRETGGRRASGSVIGRFAGKKELGTVHRKAGDDVLASSEAPQDGRIECGLVEFDGGVPVTDGEHGGDLRSYHRGRGNGSSPHVGTQVASMPRKQPMVAGEVLDSVLAFAVAGLVEFLNNLGTCHFRPAIVAIDILDEDRQTLGSVAQLCGASVTRWRPVEHDPRVAEMHLCSADPPTKLAIPIVFAKPEFLRQPSDSLADVRIGDVWQQSVGGH